MDTKTAFEKWLTDGLDENGLTAFMLIQKRADGSYQQHYVNGKWEAWTASRSAIEIDLPQRQSLCASGYGDGYFVPSSTGEGLEYDEVVEAITSHGIRINGKTE